jgi:hypothetical protein
MKLKKHPGGRPKSPKNELLIHRCVIKYSDNQANKMGGVDQARRKIRKNANQFIQSNTQ